MSDGMRDMTMRSASAGDGAAFGALIRDYPFKAYQQKVQGLDRGLLTNFLAENAQAAASDPQNAAWIVREKETPAAAAILAPNEWHARFYGAPVGRCDTFLSYIAPQRTTPILLEAIETEARRREYAFVSLRVDGSDSANLHMLERSGSVLVDCSLKMDMRIREGAPAPIPSARVRPAQNPDRHDILRIAGSAHIHNHFYNDHRLDPADTDRLFEAWVARCLDELGAIAFVVEDESGRIAGFVTYLVNRRLNERLGASIVILDYIVLDRAAQGRGLGGALLGRSLAALSERFERVELRTSQNNHPALAMYSRHGFRVIASDFLLHKWLD